MGERPTHLATSSLSTFNTQYESLPMEMFIKYVCIYSKNTCVHFLQFSSRGLLHQSLRLAYLHVHTRVVEHGTLVAGLAGRYHSLKRSVRHFGKVLKLLAASEVM